MGQSGCSRPQVIWKFVSTIHHYKNILKMQKNASQTSIRVPTLGVD